MSDLTITAENDAEIAFMASRYLWWKPVEQSGFSRLRKIAQIMHLGSYEEIRHLELLLGEDSLAQVMVKSEAGWFDDRSWDFWRGRLSLSANRSIPNERPKRTFRHAPVL
ncbi:hypothetical protein [uncultured Devosia sp.]|uniref:hypothetical protein n=1 Tax=uncultured Devosia sp. TaxID=211434 RepID=UPI0035CB05E6